MLMLKGMAMGGADVIPGVSGGTIAFITGIYEELIDSIKSVDIEAFKLLLSFELKAFWKHINGSFLVAVLMGILISILSLARLVTYLMANHPIQLWSFFFGLIIISALMVAKEIKQWNISSVLSLLAGIVVAYFITSATPASTPDGLLFVFLSGMIAICAMILPGISGSFILLILGKYQYVLGAVKELDFVVIIVFALGCLVGILSFARLVSWLLKHYHLVTVSVLVGFMIGSLNKIWPWRLVTQYRLNSKGEQVPFLETNVLPAEYLQSTGQEPLFMHAILFFALGIGLVILIDKLAAMTIKPS
jgi:putative membrane protein